MDDPKALRMVVDVRAYEFPRTVPLQVLFYSKSFVTVAIKTLECVSFQSCTRWHVIGTCLTNAPLKAL